MFTKRIWSGLILMALVLGAVMMVACAPGKADAAADDPAPLAEVDAQAYRWVAMGKAYEQMGLLNVDSEAAADATAYRWQAMARGYERMGLLNVDSEAAGEAMAYRWQAMARYYADQGLLND